MNRLRESARQFVKENGGILYDAPAHGAIMERVRSLDARSVLPERWREPVGKILAQDEAWSGNREQVDAFLRRAADVDSQRTELTRTAGGQSTGAEQLPAWNGWREDAVRVLDDAKALRQEIPRRELAAHLGFIGASTDAVDRTQELLAERIAEDEEALAAAQQRLRELERIAEDARIAAENARIAADRAWDEREAEEERRERNARDRQEGGTLPGRDASQRVTRAERAANKLADRLDACMERRDKLLERAESRLSSVSPVVKLGRAHASWRREADRALKGGRELLGNEKYGPYLDRLGGRAKIEAAIARLEKAAVIDHLPARIVAECEKLDERLRETGRHRFFLPEHERLCERMSHAHHAVRDTAAYRFIGKELDMRKDMGRQAERLDDEMDRILGCVREHETAPVRDRPFVQQENYRDWRYRAESAVAGAKAILADGREYALHFKEAPDLRETLKTVAAALEGQLRAESAEWESIESERLRIAREQRLSRDRSQGHGFSM